MSTNEPDGVPPITPRPRRRRAAPSSPDVEALPVEHIAGPEAAPQAPPAPPAAGSPPDIDEDGSWIEADAVEIHQGAVGRVDATDVSVSQGAIGAARADRVSVEMGIVGAAMGGEVTITQGMAGSILSQRARVDQAVVRTMIAQDVHVERPSAVLVMIAQRVTGDVRVLMDWRGALAFGAAFGAVAGLLGLGRRRR